MTTLPVALSSDPKDNRSILRLVDVEGLLEILETGTIALQRRLDRDGSAEDFLHRRLPEEMIRAAAASSASARGKLERWWARQQQQTEIEDLVRTVRAFRLGDLAWIDRWLVADEAAGSCWPGSVADGAVIAIQSTPRRLLAALKPDDGLRLALEPGRHLPSQPAANEGLEVVLTASDPALLPATRDRVSVAIEPETLIGAVLLAPGTSERRRTLLGHLLARHDLTAPCRVWEAKAAAPRSLAVEQA